MTEVILVGMGLIALTVGIQALGTIVIIRYLGRQRRRRPDKPITIPQAIRMLVGAALFLVLVHVIQVALWAVTYRLLPNVDELGTMESAVYFSFITFTTVGYGDVTLAPPWRILAGVEALNGVILIGWSTALLFGVLQNMWQTGGLRTGDG